MKSFAVVAALAGAAAAVTPTYTFSTKTPTASEPAGCTNNWSGTFEIEVVNATTSPSKRSVSKRSTALDITLTNGVLVDSKGRVGDIASNNQFQFDGPPQANALYTGGFSVCANGTLALGGSAIFYECLSGTFYNLYDDADAAQCSPVFIQVLGSSSSGSSAASQLGDGQITATPVITQIHDGQIQATTGAASPLTQVSDGQVQANTAAASPVSQAYDGQIQATTGSPVTQISDGQIQAPSGASSLIAVPSNGSNPTSATPSAIAFTGAAATFRVEAFGIVAGILALAVL